MPYYGKIKFFKPDAGFGFIANDDGSGDTFFHIKNADKKDAIGKNQRVSFDVHDSRSGKLQAKNIRVL
jgi:CspA family cold shock protein